MGHGAWPSAILASLNTTPECVMSCVVNVCMIHTWNSGFAMEKVIVVLLVSWCALRSIGNQVRS